MPRCPLLSILAISLTAALTTSLVLAEKPSAEHCATVKHVAPRTAAPKRVPSAAERGRKELLESHDLWLPKFREGAYDDAWKQWGLVEKPRDYDRLFRERYGLHPAEHGNDGLPMGLRYVKHDGGRSLSIDCLICHASSFNGRGLVGVPNASLDYTALVRDLAATDPKAHAPEQHALLNVTRGTTETAAIVNATFSIRNADLSLRAPKDRHQFDTGEPAPIPEEAAPWWNTRHKKGRLYLTGLVTPESRRPMMIFLLDARADAKRLASLEPRFDDIRAYLDGLEPPEYPFPVDDALVKRGLEVFENNCRECHGSYGPDGEYPNRRIPIDEIGTDSARATRAYSRAFVDFYNETWFGSTEESRWGSGGYEDERGYVAPPLHGIWATAPYLHNGSVPTVWQLLDSKSRPKKFTRSYRTDSHDYDPTRLGWRTTDVPAETPVDPTTLEGRRIYDTARPGQSNGGHTFGDHLTNDERAAVIEYLKTL